LLTGAHGAGGLHPPALPWSPLFQGDAAEAVRSAAEETLEALLDWPRRENPGLPGGHAGLALVCGYGAQVLGDARLRDRSQEFLNLAVAGIAAQPTLPALHGGFSGVAWVRAHLNRQTAASPDDRGYEEIDATLARSIDLSPPESNYDLIGGLAGLGLYALERGADSGARPVLDRVVVRLVTMAEPRPDGVTWLTPPHLLPEHQRTQTPLGCYNLGLAHGIPGILVVLARAGAAGALDDRGCEVLERGVQWLLAQQQTFANGTRFPHLIPRGFEDRQSGSRVAWCYGDLGIAAALVVAGKCHDRADWVSAALDIARSAATIPEEKSGVLDHGFCHGSVGNAHLFHRIYRATGDAALAGAARSWFAQLLRTRQNLGIGGFVSWRARNPTGVGAAAMDYAHLPDPSLLTGSAGVVAGLLAANSDVEPEWDRCFAVSAVRDENRPNVGGSAH